MSSIRFWLFILSSFEVDGHAVVLPLQLLDYSIPLIDNLLTGLSNIFSSLAQI